MSKLKSVSKAENEALKIAAVGVLGALGIYALIRSAPAIGTLFTSGINNIISGITAGLPSFTSSSSSGSTPASSSGIKYAIDPNSYQSPPYQTPTTVQQAQADQSNAKVTGSPDLSGLLNIFAPGGQYSQLQPDQQANVAKLVQMGYTLINSDPGVNLANRPDLRAQENLAREAVQYQPVSAQADILGPENVGLPLYKLSNGSIEPLSSAALAYYAQIGVHPIHIQ